MTRINLVNVQDLADQHLMAEWREMKMIPPALRRTLVSQQKIYDKGLLDPVILMQYQIPPYVVVINNIPKRYTLNTGHVTFFYNKLEWLKFRYEELTQELLTRGYELSDLREFNVYVSNLPAIFHKSFVPDLAEKKVNIDRIVQRLNEKPTFYRFHGDVVPPSFFEERYAQQLTIDTLK